MANQAKMEFLKSQDLLMCQRGHTIFSHSCKACRNLKNEWYSYLAASGFEDHEKDGQLKVTVNSHQTAKDWQDETLFHSRVNYYQWARSKLNDGGFTSERDKLIWECHTEGLSSREIAPRFDIHQSNIVRAVNRIKNSLAKVIGSMSLTQEIA